MGDLWNRLFRRSRNAAVEREVAREKMSPEERELADESLEDIQADDFAGEQLLGIDADRLLGGNRPPPQDEPPRY